jgi:hypothetical protein
MRNFNEIILILLCIAVIFSAGCTNQTVPSASTTSPTPTIVLPTTALPSVVTTLPIPTTTPIITVTPNVTTKSIPKLSISTIATPVPQITKTAADDPRVENFRTINERYGISECIMKQVFPDIVNDPNYGLNSANPKLVGLSAEKWNAFYKDWTTGKTTGMSQTFSVSKCQNVPISESTTWDFAYVSARIVPTNGNPSDYTIILTLTSNGKSVAQIITNETLTIDQPITIESWIPIKRTEIGSLGNPSISFNKLTNI